MKANAGGNLEPQHVYGRDQFIELLWHTLESQSVLQSGERRTGKTQILRKMLQQPKPGWKPIFRDLEKIHSALEFAELVYDDVQQFLGTSTRAKNFIQRWFEHHETDYINLKSRTWKQLLNSAITDLDKAGLPEKLVFFWDEVPWMLDSICRHEGIPVAAQVLDAIRSLRVEHSTFRVILTGSIGIHHIVAGLRLKQISVTPDTIRHHVRQQLVDASDPRPATRSVCTATDTAPRHCHSGTT